MRSFIPQFSSYVDDSFLNDMLPHTNWIGFNYFDLLHNRIFPKVKKHGIRDVYNISDKKKIFLSTTEKDELLINYYNNQNGLNDFILNVEELDADLVMGPDWFVYEKMGIQEKTRHITKASLMNQKCLSCDKIIPNIHGTNIHELSEFIKPFKELGSDLFVLPGREYFRRKGDVKNSQKQFYGFTSYLKRIEEVELLVTGISSPRVHRYLSDVKYFVGQGWDIQAAFRQIIDDLTFKKIVNGLELDQNIVENVSLNELLDEEYDSLRALYNLIKINEKINETRILKQKILGEYFGS